MLFSRCVDRRSFDQLAFSDIFLSMLFSRCVDRRSFDQRALSVQSIFFSRCVDRRSFDQRALSIQSIFFCRCFSVDVLTGDRLTSERFPYNRSFSVDAFQPMSTLVLDRQSIRGCTCTQSIANYYSNLIRLTNFRSVVPRGGASRALLHSRC